MGNILNPVGNNSFVELAAFRDEDVFADKTDFIAKTNKRFDRDGNLLVFARPRRFGKTVTAHMLLAYYSRAYAGQHIFDGLKIAGNDSYIKHLNRHDALYIDMNSISSHFKNYLKKSKMVQGVESLVDYLEYSIIRELREQEDFAACFDKNEIENIGLPEALSALRNDLGVKFVFIMDDWDLIFRKYRNDEQLQKEFIDFLKGLFKSDDGLACFSLAYLTGILPIRKDSSQSGLNTFSEYTMLDPVPFESFFGFTEADISEIMKLPSCKLTQEELKDWYRGYKLNGSDIYNPDSVVSAVKDGKCKGYWSGTVANEELARLINMNFEGLRDDILDLIAGGLVKFGFLMFNNDMVTIRSKDDVFSLLVCLGYLGCADYGDCCRLAYVPNREIRSALASIARMQSWYNSMPIIERSARLFNAIRALDSSETAGIIAEIHNSPCVSLLGYYSAEALACCVTGGLMWQTDGDYECFRKLQSGKGYADVIYVPKRNDSLPILLIEFRHDTSAEDAMNQIKEKEYFERYRDGDYPNEVILTGLNYSSKTKEHQCLIEKLQK
ncbi:AAA family ATPase [Succinimonas sp.]|uniref:AAA family ATPase n=1 Tax=Succinimonas sp. TaxID=1936151 RepID=UPI0038661B4F